MNTEDNTEHNDEEEMRGGCYYSGRLVAVVAAPQHGADLGAAAACMAAWPAALAPGAWRRAR